MNNLKKWLAIPPVYYLRMRELRRLDRFPIHQERLIYHCELNSSKRRNLARQAINRALLKHVELASPHILHVGVTTHCNLSCPACPTGQSSLGRAREHLDYDLYRRTVDALRHALLFMLFWDWGEPLLHPRLPEMIAYAGKSRIKSVISTNGNIPNAPVQMQRLVASGPTAVIACVDGADQETYQTYRVGGRLRKVLQTIRRLADAREQLKSAYPLIEFRSLATRQTEHQLPALLALARDSGADLFSVKTLRPYDYRGRDIDAALTPAEVRLARYRYEGNIPEAANRLDFASKGPLRCAKPLYAPTLNADGTLAFCSYARRENEMFGSLARAPFRSLWKNAASRQRRLHFISSGGMRACRTCFFRSNHAPTVIHQVPLRPIPDGIEVEAPRSPDAFLEAIAAHPLSDRLQGGTLLKYAG